MCSDRTTPEEMEGFCLELGRKGKGGGGGRASQGLEGL